MGHCRGADGRTHERRRSTGDRIEENRRDELERALCRRGGGVGVVAMPAPLSPRVVRHYCHMRGFIQCLWKCGGALAAPALKESAAHKVFAFVAPKRIGGVDNMTALDEAKRTTRYYGEGIEGGRGGGPSTLFCNVSYSYRHRRRRRCDDTLLCPHIFFVYPITLEVFAEPLASVRTAN